MEISYINLFSRRMRCTSSRIKKKRTFITESINKHLIIIVFQCLRVHDEKLQI